MQKVLSPNATARREIVRERPNASPIQQRKDKGDFRLEAAKYRWAKKESLSIQVKGPNKGRKEVSKCRKTEDFQTKRPRVQ